MNAIGLTGLMTLAVTLMTGADVQAQGTQSGPLRIGIIGTGRIGGALARHWVRAGHEVLISSRNPDELRTLANELGPKARVGTPKEAAAFSNIVLASVPYGAMPQIGTDLAAELNGKIVIDTSNPVEARDGAMALEAQKKGAGVATAGFLKGAPARLAIPIGSDDATAQRLVRDAGFDQVVVGSLAETRRFDLGQPLALGDQTAAQLQAKVSAR